MKVSPKGWSTEDEISTLDYLASSEPRQKGGYVPTKAERKAKVQSWLEHCDKREWPRSVDVAACKNYAQAIVKGL